MKLIAFLFMNGLGFLSVGGALIYALHYTDVASLPNDLKDQAWTYLSAGTMISWVLSGLFSVFFLFIKSSVRFLFLFLPIIVPVGYSIYILSIFN